MTLDDCLPPDLQGPTTTISRIAAGLSSAGVYRVEVAGHSFVLKVSGDAEPLSAWRQKTHIQHLAAAAGLAPRILHVDESRRAVVSAFVVDRSFLALYGNPSSREGAVTLLGQTFRRLHDLPLAPDAVAKEPREVLAAVWSGLPATFAVPAFVGGAVRRVLTEDPPARDRPLVTSHNDANPSNFAYDGERLVLVDWETAGPNDPFYDLAAVSVFLRMDEATCARLIAAHDGEPASTPLPVRFGYGRRLVAVLCGAMFLQLARQGGHAGAAGDETLESTGSMGEFYQRMRSGAVQVGSPEGSWAFGLALVKESLSL